MRHVVYCTIAPRYRRQDPRGIKLPNNAVVATFFPRQSRGVCWLAWRARRPISPAQLRRRVRCYTRDLCLPSARFLPYLCIFQPAPGNLSPLPSPHLPLHRRRRTPAHAPLVPATLLKPLAGAHVEIAIELRAGLLAMDEVAEAAADAALARVEAAARLAEVGDGRQLAVDGAARVPAAVERVTGLLAVLLVLEAHVDVADEICKDGGLARMHAPSRCAKQAQERKGRGSANLRSLLLSHTTTSSTSPY
jgi:hypothetical protein